MANNVQTLVVDNFMGSMTQYVNGDINSGRSNVFESSGANPFPYFGKLTWNAKATRIDPNESVITDLIMAGKERVENGILYVYAIGHTGRVYKIQVNDPTTFNPDYDNPVLLATLTQESPTFTRGGFIDFFGSTSRIVIGHDKGVTRLDFDGTNETFVGSAGSWVQTVPRPLQQFLGKLYVGNGDNIAEIDSTMTVTTYTKLTPGFPTGTQTRDIDATPEGNYIQMVVSRLALSDQTTAAQDTTTTANSDSFIFKWNGTEAGYTSFSTFPSFSLVSNILFQDKQFTFGYDQNGMAAFNPINKILSLQEVRAPSPNALASVGNMVSFMTPVYFGGALEAELFYFGTVDFEMGLGFWDMYFQLATGTETDVVRIPCQIPVSNFGVGASSNGYNENIFSTSKIYFSTLETSAAPTTKYKLYKLPFLTTPFALQTQETVEGGVYQTQTQLFSKKVKPVQVRVYGEPWIADNSFTIDLIGSDNLPIPNGSMTFTAGSNLTVGNDFAWYDPATEATYAIGLRVTNAGANNFVINKVEIDYTAYGK